jgi:hypothetical protein
MASIGVTRKLFIDSRYKVSGTDVDFLVELPTDIDCTRTSSFFVASCSFANTFQTATPDNNKFYYFMINYNDFSYVLYVSTIPPGNYQDPTAFAAALKASFVGPDPDDVTWNPTTGTFTIDFKVQGQNQIAFMIPSASDIDTFVRYYTAPGAAPGGFQVYDVALGRVVPFTVGGKLRSINSIQNMPSQASQWNVFRTTPFQSGIVDLTPVREVYLHSSLANNRTMHLNGSRDCIARIPIDVSFGEVVTYRHLGPTDALSCSDFHFRTIRFTLRDWSGNLVPQPFSFVVIELCFLDSDPYAL